MEPILVVPLEKAWSRSAESSGGRARWLSKKDVKAAADRAQAGVQRRGLPTKAQIKEIADRAEGKVGIQKWGPIEPESERARTKRIERISSDPMGWTKLAPKDLDEHESSMEEHDAGVLLDQAHEAWLKSVEEKGLDHPDTKRLQKLHQKAMDEYAMFQPVED